MKAIETNVFAVLYLAFRSYFDDSVEYANEVKGYGGSSGVLEAIEYCNDTEIRSVWEETEGALEWINGQVVELVNGEGGDELRAWEGKLKGEEEGVVEEDAEVDLSMYCGFVRTAMEMMLEDVGGGGDGDEDVEDDKDEEEEEGNDSDEESVPDLTTGKE